MYSTHNENSELNNAIRILQDNISNYMKHLIADGDQLAIDAYKAYLVDKTKKSSEQIISDACSELLFLINSAELYGDLTQYIRAKKFCDSSVESICYLIKELTGEVLLPSETFDANRKKLSDLSALLAKRGITPTWLISHGLASEQEMRRFQESTNATGITYKKLKTGIRIETVEASGGIVIPDFIEGLPVVKLSDKAFYKRKDISSVILPRHLTEIGCEAFSESGIVSINIPNTVKRIGDRAFFNCRKLESIYLPEQIKMINYKAFGGCSALTRIKIPLGVISIDSCAFERCKKLKKVQIPDSVTRIGVWVFDSKPTIYCNEKTRASRYVADNYLPHPKPYELYDKEV